ncbi:MAG: saccharopine dehydrogenase NADP-binding domain-containing protein [Taibaiella sp.]|nr:saccharopine dehydrogenase NADP-binding domain-containing protein [Taibaiella sp.]
MQTILVAGAGKSSTYLIQYLLTYAPQHKWKVIIADGDANAIAEKINGNPHGESAVIDITNAEQRAPLVKQADIVISLMPPQLHIHLAKDCLLYKKNLITSSYISDELRLMDKEVKEAGLMFMCEMGLDPGIDHMTANKIIHSIHRVAGSIYSFKSYCGGLIAPESDNNPWHYKFSWNPKNIITAGLGGAKYLSNGKEVEIPYEKIFDNNKKIKVEGLGQLAYYPNRDSLKYLETYDIPDIKTFLRATLRYPAFCVGWQAMIQLGLTTHEDTFVKNGQTYTSWMMAKAGCKAGASPKECIAEKLGVETDSKAMELLQWLGMFDDLPLKPGTQSSGDILLELLLEKWAMASAEKDMVVMQHEVEYTHKERKTKLTSTMIIKGENRDFSAMAKTVGLPMGILARMVLNKKINPPTGVHIPNMAIVYKPVLTELAHHGISFNEEIE